MYNAGPRRAAAGSARGGPGASATSALCRGVALGVLLTLAATAAFLALSPVCSTLRHPAAGTAERLVSPAAVAAVDRSSAVPAQIDSEEEVSRVRQVSAALSPAPPAPPPTSQADTGGDTAGTEPFPPPPAWQRGGGPRPPGSATAAGPNGFFARLRSYGFAPSVILDVGANEGAWAREAWAAFGAPSSSSPPGLFLFEGAPGRAPVLSATGFDFVIAVMGPRTRWVDFYASDNPALHTGNSVLRENSRHFAVVAPTRSIMRTLDELVATRPGADGALAGLGASSPLINGPVLLKLDVQGYEIEVLRGATRTLLTVDVLLLETSVMPYNKGSPLTVEVMAFIGSLGFDVLDMLELHHGGAPGLPANVLIQMDFAFVRRGGSLQRKAAEAAGLTLD